MNLYVRGAASLELPLRVLNLLAQHGAVVEQATLDLDESGYGIALNLASVAAGRDTLIVEKLRSIVLVSHVKILGREGA